MAPTIGIGLLERERRRQGLSTGQLAELMGVSHSALSQAERGHQQPSQAFKEKASTALGVRVEDLWPEWFFLAYVQRTGIRVRAVGGKAVAFTRASKAARRAAMDSRLRVCGPAPPAFFALAYGITEAEVPDQLLVDPSPRELENHRRALTKDGAAPTQSRAVLTSEKPLDGARHDQA